MAKESSTKTSAPQTSLPAVLLPQNARLMIVLLLDCGEDILDMHVSCNELFHNHLLCKCVSIVVSKHLEMHVILNV